MQFVYEQVCAIVFGVVMVSDGWKSGKKRLHRQCDKTGGNVGRGMTWGRV